MEQRRFALHTLRDLGFGKSRMEVLLAEEASELCKQLETYGDQPVDVRNEFNIAILNALWTILSNERFAYGDPKPKR